MLFMPSVIGTKPKCNLATKKSHKSNKGKLPFGLLCETKRENIVKFTANEKKIFETKCSR